ncbi:MAG: PilW family protein [Marinicellaceae bacterium]
MKSLKNINIKPKKHNTGFSIVELMVAIAIGVIVLTGLIQVFDTSSKMNRTQNGLARIQENGRYAISLMKQTIEQTGYQYCFGESNKETAKEAQPTKVAWDVKSLPFIPGFGIGPFDPSYLLRGHECDAAGTCQPALNSLGSNTTAMIPAVGVSDGDRIAGTDVLTVRYISGQGREIDSVAGNTLTLTSWSAANPPDTTTAPTPSSGQWLVVSCGTGISYPEVVTEIASSTNTIVVTPNVKSDITLAKAFNMQRDFTTATYYVANNRVDDRDIPTLYSNFNGVTNAVIEGVDAFDVIYGVRDSQGLIRYLNASGVESLTGADCWPEVLNETNNTTLPNNQGCGWRSVVTIDIHMLLNTIYNSSPNSNEEFRYSQYGGEFYNESDLPSGINHYSMHRREFTTSIALKNIMQ